MKIIKRLFAAIVRKKSTGLEKEEIRQFIKQEVKRQLEQSTRMDNYLKRIR